MNQYFTFDMDRLFLQIRASSVRDNELEYRYYYVLNDYIMLTSHRTILQYAISELSQASVSKRG